ncbi:putative quinol monooxygenase [Tropicimonas sediminicola]|uniref:Ethyl tert-butyl ether degradation EthD n=1 Tax=Tropicimonas sediminicola TaxID=1031541 RepID=A0A239J0F3_9RHOB|nr:hypothetical protein [Tropicimonas sediminicola]SNS99381.1 hypothetical protein SAMN05421757_10545 [Tropicimonas sediminicola]
MITRYALFDGTIKDGKTDAFRAAIRDRLVPVLRTFDGVLEVSIAFTDERDDGAPDLPLIMAVSYPDVETMQAALSSPKRQAAIAVTGEIFAECFDGHIHHHVTQRTAFPI